MSDIDSIPPLVTPASPALLGALDFPVSDYSERFVDLAFWRPYVETIATAHDLPVGEISMGEPGSFPTFILGRRLVAKFFGEHYGGLRSWAVERDVARLIPSTGLATPVPGVVAAGVLSRDPVWRYLVTTFMPGEPFAVASPQLSAAARLGVAGEVGGMLRDVHALTIPAGTVLGDGWSGWTTFVDRQRRDVTERHRRWNVLPDHLLAGIDAFVAGYRAPDGTPPSLVHADLHDHHLIGDANGDGWTISGVIDWGDARLGDRFYELPALHFGFCHGNRAMLGAFLAAYGWPDDHSHAFARRAMAMTLLQEFNVLEHVGSKVDLDATATLDDLAAALWQV